jgi:enoyl-[acyl-carrier-protein] reductase (NADH)
MTEKPEHVLQLEVQYGNDIEPILQQMLAQFNDVDILSRTLGITPEQLDELCEQYFSCKALDYNMSGQQAKATEQANDYSKIINEIKAIADKLARELPAIFELRLSHE